MIRVEVVYSPGPGQVHCDQMDLPQGATLGDALKVCAGRQAWLTQPGVDLTMADTGVWGRRHPLTHSLREGDRVEIYRPLRCDPKEARRRRQRKTERSRSPRSTSGSHSAER